MSNIVHSVGTGRSNVALASALRWSVLSIETISKRATNKIVRNKAALVNGSHYGILSLGTTTYLGTYTQAALSIESPKVIHSLALAFVAALVAAGADINSINAILLMQPQHSPDKRTLVVVEGGEIVRDDVDSSANAIANALAARELMPSHRIYTQYTEIPGSEIVTWDQLFSSLGPTTVLQATPRNPLLLWGVLVLVLAGFTFAAVQKLVIEPERKRQRAAAAAALDKTPAYVSELRKSLSSTGWERADLSKAIAQLQNHIFYSTGWILENRECSASAQSCTIMLKRAGGQLSSLLSLFPKAVYEVADSTLDTAKMTEAQTMVPARMEPDDLPTSDTAAKQLREVLQRFSNAGIAITSGASEKWPVMDFSKVKAPVIATRGTLEITAPLPKIDDILSLLPPFVQVDSYRLIVSTDDASSYFKVTLKGSVYAR
jgi:hypothetical protein